MDIEMTQKELYSALNKDIKSLYIDLGKEIFSSEFSLKPLSIEEYIESANNWLNENHCKLKKVICSNKKIIQLVNNPKTNSRIVLAAAILDLILDISIGVSPITVAALIVNEGLDTLCSI